MNETEVRVMIDRLLEMSGWRLPGAVPPNVGAAKRIKKGGKNLEADYVLYGPGNFPLAVLEAKRAQTGPLAGKEQAREYAEELRAPFVILSNGKEHYFWEIGRHEPARIDKMPSPKELERRRGGSAAPQKFSSHVVAENYIADAQGADCPPHKRRRMRGYQIDAVRAVQRAADAGARKFLLEMATGTGKTLVSAAAIKLFLTTGNARRVLFVVDRLELERQAKTNFDLYFGNSWRTVIYKENRSDWEKAEIVVSTVQTLAAGKKFKRFSPLDFDLLIVDEAHRAVNGRGAREVFDYFCACKLGLTATPKDYLRGADGGGAMPKETEARKLLDTYHTFGCESGEPTYRYDLEKGAANGHLIMPRIIDARTEVTTDMLAEKGFSFTVTEDDETEQKGPFRREDYETKLFSEATNKAVCRAFMDNAARDPVSGDVGKTVVYCVSQRHAGKIAKILNEIAAEKHPGKYNSDFAVQVTSTVRDAAEYSRQFANNNLNGKTAAPDGYDSPKTRVCVTVGMMTTGYDCPDILNICLMRPVFSPSEFIQMRGRGTRPHEFYYDGGGGKIQKVKKDGFMLFDFFAVCEHFEKTRDYDQKLPLPGGGGGSGESEDPEEHPDAAIYKGKDALKWLGEIVIAGGMRIDREQRSSAEQTLRADSELRKMVNEDRMADAVNFCVRVHPEETRTLKALAEEHRRELDRAVNIGEVLALLFGKIGGLRNREELLDEKAEEFAAALENNDPEIVSAACEIFKACLDDGGVMEIVEKGELARLADNPVLSAEICKKVPPDIRQQIIRHVREKADASVFASPSGG